MQRFLTDAQRSHYEDFKAYVRQNVEPQAAEWDHLQRIPSATLANMAQHGYMGCGLPQEYGGQGWDRVTVGLLNEAFGKGSSALADVLTCQAMVSTALLKWGTPEQKHRWLPKLARGEVIAGFALTEPGAGSATQSLTTQFAESSSGDALILNGTKKWISCAQFAAVFLVFGCFEQRPLACLVPRESAGVQISPISDLLGFRAAGLAEVQFHKVVVPPVDVIGKPGFGLTHVAQVGLHHGRISTACSALGLLRGCLEASAAHAAKRRIGNKTSGEFGMVRSLIARMGTDLAAATLLCYDACRVEDDHLPEAFEKALLAKYFSSRAVVRAASDAVQIQGAAGCHASSPVARYYRDAKVMEIIEGTTQIHEDLLGKMFVDRIGEHGH